MAAPGSQGYSPLGAPPPLPSRTSKPAAVTPIAFPSIPSTSSSHASYAQQQQQPPPQQVQHQQHQQQPPSMRPIGERQPSAQSMEAQVEQLGRKASTGLNKLFSSVQKTIIEPLLTPVVDDGPGTSSTTTTTAVLFPLPVVKVTTTKATSAPVQPQYAPSASTQHSFSGQEQRGQDFFGGVHNSAPAPPPSYSSAALQREQLGSVGRGSGRNESASVGRSKSFIGQDIGRHALKLSNEFRGRQGKSGMLEWNDTLFELCVEHSRNMAEGKCPFSHDGFKERVARYGFRSRNSAENVFQCSKRPVGLALASLAVDGWINSPGHRKNLLGEFTVAAVGHYQSQRDGTIYFTQLFARP